VTRIELTVGAFAPGGHWVARAPDGRVVFVRHALAGERVLAEITEEHPGFLRADAVEVLAAAQGASAGQRVAPPCPYAGRCGGCDLQHVAPQAHASLKAAVVREQLTRLARLSAAEVEALAVRVEALPGGPLGWRSRLRYTVDDAGRPGLLGYRSHTVVPVDRCRIAHPAVQALRLSGEPGEELSMVASSAGDVTVTGSATGRVRGPAVVRERAVGREWTVPAEAFWQVHPAAPDTLAGAVLDQLRPDPAQTAWDLYGGAGLFTAALAPRLASVVLVESDRAAVAAARESLADLTNIHIVRSTVERFRYRDRPDLVVLDPPRSGAGAAVVRTVAAQCRRAISYVSCDPASFARDVARFAGSGWRLTALRCFDAFPMTHHVELVGLLLPG
jgi:tRNA/tmRNA/rRNA uracil-C5-methylase (TrmA/RlmC/RlmD family)